MHGGLRCANPPYVFNGMTNHLLNNHRLRRLLNSRQSRVSGSRKEIRLASSFNGCDTSSALHLSLIHI